uniref:Very-long-chain 3-oxoacyl-CoA reductase 1 n=1 Tax=Ananas comosus var. bracteatus TaxID=296719 RepID=A0A6V7NNX3_ANACO|nr:unnamed protein product [Ananas comosus var. bracteatus]
MMKIIINHLRGLPSWLLLLSILGLFSLVSNLLVPLLKWLYAAFLRPRKDLARSYGSWAVVTGATDGIGRAVAFQLACGGGLHLLLVGRNPAKLRQVAADIAAACGGGGGLVKVRTVVIDLAGDAAEGRRRLERAIEGWTSACWSITPARRTPARRTRMKCRRRREHRGHHLGGPYSDTKDGGEGKRCGCEHRSASGTALPSFPFHAIYSATKAYIDQLSKSLNVEYKDKGIDVQCQIPFYVATKMISAKGSSSLLVPSPDQFAAAAVRWIGYESICAPYWPHAVQWFFASLFPDFVLNAWRLHVGIRKRNESIALLDS